MNNIIISISLKNCTLKDLKSMKVNTTDVNHVVDGQPLIPFNNGIMLEKKCGLIHVYFNRFSIIEHVNDSANPREGQGIKFFICTSLDAGRVYVREVKQTPHPSIIQMCQLNWMQFGITVKNIIQLIALYTIKTVYQTMNRVRRKLYKQDNK